MVAGAGRWKILSQPVKPMEGEITFCTYIAPYVAKWLRKGGCLQSLHIQGMTRLLNLRMDHTIKINETHDPTKHVVHCLAVSNHNS